MIIRAITAADASTLSEVRLRALLDSPLAFVSTYATESALAESEWITKAKQWTQPHHAATFLAFDQNICCGIVACFKDTQVERRVWLVSMWVAPEARRKHLGQQLVAGVERWAAAQGASQIMLHVTEGNTPAIEFYVRCGFEFTGETIPHAHAANLRELAMVKHLDGKSHLC